MSKVYGVDVGTMFFQVSKEDNGKIRYKTIRNTFVELPDTGDTEELLENNNWQYVKDGDNYYVIGEEALKVARLFPKIELRRPLQGGVLNPEEEKKMIVLAKMIESSIGKADKDETSVVCTCVSSESVDDSVNSKMHQARLKSMFQRLGWDVKIIEEGMAVILSERPVIEEDGKEIPFSGIGVSFGGGRTNLVLAYKGVQILGFSVQMGGDWIDDQVVQQINEPITKITSYKENELDFDNIDYDSDLCFALDVFYGSLIENVFNTFAEKFKKIDTQFDAPLEIVVAGGTSMPSGFVSKVKEVIDGIDLPFTIKDVKHAKDPRNTVARGLLAQAQAHALKLEKENSSD